MAPGELLAPLCHCAMSIRLPEIDYHLPASLQPLLLVCTSNLAVRRAERWQPMARLSLCGPTRFPQTVRAAADTLLLTVSIRPGQLQRLYDANALALRDQCIALDEAVQPTDRGAHRPGAAAVRAAFSGQPRSVLARLSAAVALQPGAGAPAWPRRRRPLGRARSTGAAATSRTCSATSSLFAGWFPMRLTSGVAGCDSALWRLLAARGRTTPLFGPSGH